VAPRFRGDGVSVDYAVVQRPEEALEEPKMRIALATIVESGWSRFDRKCAITWRDEMIVKPSEAMALPAFDEVVDSLTNFFLVCARESVELRYIRGLLPSGEMISYLGNPTRRKSRITAREWILTLNELGGRLKEVLERWLALVKKMGFAGPVFFSELSNPSPAQDARLFHFAGCLEAFHREVVQREIGKYLPKAEYRRIVTGLLDHLPEALTPALKESMRASLSHANDYSFAERITALFNGLEPETRRELADEPERFLAALKRSRNKLAHVTEGTDGETFEGRQFAHANVSLRAWLTILILRECGISESLVLARMRAADFFFWGPFKFEP
jgi:hypothetical protein